MSQSLRHFLRHANGRWQYLQIFSGRGDVILIRSVQPALRQPSRRNRANQASTWIRQATCPRQQYYSNPNWYRDRVLCSRLPPEGEFQHEFQVDDDELIGRADSVVVHEVVNLSGAAVISPRGLITVYENRALFIEIISMFSNRIA